MMRRAFVFVCLFFFSFYVGVLLQTRASATSSGFPDDGTYREEVVSSVTACQALCEADRKTCRGTVAEQPDIRYERYICRLNNGFGANPLFPVEPPEPLDRFTALEDFNAYRARYGLQPVTLNPLLSQASRVHAQDLAANDMISHTGSDGSGHGERVQRQGYYFTIAAENVATGQKSWDEVFQAWKDSPGHNENLLRADVNEFGIAMVYDLHTQHQTYWAMLVAAPMPDDHIPYIINQSSH